jgi:hypothetical protein
VERHGAQVAVRGPGCAAEVTRDGQLAGGGNYTISGSTIIFKRKISGGCLSAGKCHFALSGRQLKFTRSATTARIDLASHTFTRT